MNDSNVYISNPHNKKYLDIIGGVELQKVVDREVDSDQKCCHNINKIQKYIYDNGKYIGYCFNLVVESEELMLCWDDQENTKNIRNRVIDQIVTNMKKNKK